MSTDSPLAATSSRTQQPWARAQHHGRRPADCHHHQREPQVCSKAPDLRHTDAVWPLAEEREVRLEPHGKPLLHDSAPWAELPERGDGSRGELGLFPPPAVQHLLLDYIKQGGCTSGARELRVCLSCPRGHVGEGRTVTTSSQRPSDCWSQGSRRSSLGVQGKGVDD